MCVAAAIGAVWCTPVRAWRLRSWGHHLRIGGPPSSIRLGIPQLPLVRVVASGRPTATTVVVARERIRALPTVRRKLCVCLGHPQKPSDWHTPDTWRCVPGRRRKWCLSCTQHPPGRAPPLPPALRCCLPGSVLQAGPPEAAVPGIAAAASPAAAAAPARSGQPAVLSEGACRHACRCCWRPSCPRRARGRAQASECRCYRAHAAPA
eukprot:360578-Chlamydomonas_euryale.AAC.22